MSTGSSLCVHMTVDLNCKNMTVNLNSKTCRSSSKFLQMQMSFYDHWKPPLCSSAAYYINSFSPGGGARCLKTQAHLYDVFVMSLLTRVCPVCFRWRTSAEGTWAGGRGPNVQRQRSSVCMDNWRATNRARKDMQSKAGWGVWKPFLC